MRCSSFPVPFWFPCLLHWVFWFQVIQTVSFSVHKKEDVDLLQMWCQGKMSPSLGQMVPCRGLHTDNYACSSHAVWSKWNTLELYPNFDTSLFSVQELQWFGITACLSTLNHHRWGQRNFIIATQLSLLWHVTLLAALQNSLEVWGVLLSNNLLPSREKTVFCYMKDGTDVIKLKKIRQLMVLG